MIVVSLKQTETFPWYINLAIRHANMTYIAISSYLDQISVCLMKLAFSKIRL